MLRCISLGQNALGSAAPNPMVGAVLVYQEKIIGEGYTSAFGGSHAEVNAIASVADKSLLKSATLYVTLEPCSHHGKTPPCADLIVKYGIPEVVIGLKDPNPKVAGNGIKRLKAAGCKVKVGILEKQCSAHHKRFLSAFEKKRPYVILKWAQTLDGFLAPLSELRGATSMPYWITNGHSRQLVHKWRSEEAAILVGTKTVVADNPKLNVRRWSGKNPVRLVIDKHVRLDHTAHVFNGKIKTFVFHHNKNDRGVAKNVTYVAIDFDKNVPLQICDFLYKEQLNSVIIEGGCFTLQQFIDRGLWDEARIFTGNISFEDGICAPEISGTVKTTKKILTDTLSIVYND